MNLGMAIPKVQAPCPIVVTGGKIDNKATRPPLFIVTTK